MTIPEMLEKRVKATPFSIAHYTASSSGTWNKTTWKEYYDRVCGLICGFKAIGLRPGHCIGIMAKTSQTWEYIQMAVLMSGGVVVGIDPSETRENMNHIVRKSGLSGIFVQTIKMLEKIDHDLISQLAYIVSIEDCNEEKSYYQFSHMDVSGQMDSIQISPHDPATIIFTSGTSGEPKGVSYTHAQVTLACFAILDGFPDIDSQSNLPCWLPLSNLFQRIINFCAMEIGASTYFIENPREMIDLLPKIQPHLFIGVPRVFEKLYGAIEAQIMAKPLWQKKLIKIAVKAGEAHAVSQRTKAKSGFWETVLYIIMDKLVLKRIRSFLGSNIKYLISGSAPMPVWLLERYHALGILVLEAYGISENIIPNAMNIPGDYRFGTVGKPLRQNQTKLLEDGELLVKGPGVFNGYYKDDAKKDLFTKDGYFPTGDYASFDQDGFLSITGRKSEVFKTSTGRKISPVSIESRLQQISYIEHAVLFGQGKKLLTALMTISPQGLAKRLEKKEGAAMDFKTLLSRSVLEMIAHDVFLTIEPLPDFKRPAGIFLTDYLLSVETKEMTANLKLKRKNIEEKFNPYIEQMNSYMEKGIVPEKINLFKSIENLTLFF
ncbi:MAG: AMP-binding protein [Desulfobacula sp.]